MSAAKTKTIIDLMWSMLREHRRAHAGSPLRDPTRFEIGHEQRADIIKISNPYMGPVRINLETGRLESVFGVPILLKDVGNLLELVK